MPDRAGASRLTGVKSLLRWFAIGLAVLVVLLAAAYVGHGLHGAVQVENAKKAAVAQLAAALPDSKAQSIRDRDQARDRYVVSWGRPAYAWQELVCELDTVDSGWIVQEYTQQCRIRSVDLIPTATSGRDGRCVSTQFPAATPGAAPESAWQYGALATVGPSGAFDDQHPYRHGCPGGIVEPSPYATTVLLTGRRPASLDASPGWIVVDLTTHVSTTTLGCSPWALLFCSEPVDHPVVGDIG
jgi:hypothetical protein